MVRPIPGAISRAEYEEGTLDEPHEVDAPTFAANLSKAMNEVERFATTDEDFEAGVSDWEVRNSDVVDLLALTIDRLAYAAGLTPDFYLSEDFIGYPQFHAVWQSEARYRSVELRDGNDNDNLRWFVGPGHFAPYPHYIVTTALTREQFFKRVDETFERSKTIYPHIERYSLCLPWCD